MDLKQVEKVNEQVIRGADGSAGNVPQPPPGTPGLTGIVFYPLDETGGTTAADAAGDNDATLVGGAAFVAGHNGNGVSFDGGTQYIDTGGPLLNTASDYSAAAWVRLDKADGAFQTIVSQDGNDRALPAAEIRELYASGN